MILTGVAVVALASPMVDLNTAMEESTVMVTTSDAQGTAFFATPTQLITSAHVVEGSSGVRLTFAPESAQGPVSALVTYEDSDSDVAVLTVAHGAFPPLSLAAGQPARNSPAYVIGAPDGDFRVTAGVVLHVDPATGQVTSSARVFPGNSGGPMVNEEGEVIGLVAQRTEPSNESVAIGTTEIKAALAGEQASPPVPSPVHSATAKPVIVWLAGITLALGAGMALIATRLLVRRRTDSHHITITLD